MATQAGPLAGPEPEEKKRDIKNDNEWTFD